MLWAYLHAPSCAEGGVVAGMDVLKAFRALRWGCVHVQLSAPSVVKSLLFVLSQDQTAFLFTHHTPCPPFPHRCKLPDGTLLPQGFAPPTHRSRHSRGTRTPPSPRGQSRLRPSVSLELEEGPLQLKASQHRGVTPTI